MRLRSPLFAGWVLGLLTCAMAAAVWIGLILSGVLFDTSASTPHSKAFAWTIHVTMIHSVQRRALGWVSHEPVDRASLLSGATEYADHCVGCHGGPGFDRAPWASAMLPTPPFLIDAPGRWSHAQLHKLVRDGVKMTGMPAWGEIDTDKQIDDVVRFVEFMPKLSPAQFAQLMRTRAPAAAVGQPRR